VSSREWRTRSHGIAIQRESRHTSAIASASVRYAGLISKCFIWLADVINQVIGGEGSCSVSHSESSRYRVVRRRLNAQRHLIEIGTSSEQRRTFGRRVQRKPSSAAAGWAALDYGVHKADWCGPPGHAPQVYYPGTPAMHCLYGINSFVLVIYCCTSRPESGVGRFVGYH